MFKTRRSFKRTHSQAVQLTTSTGHNGATTKLSQFRLSWQQQPKRNIKPKHAYVHDLITVSDGGGLKGDPRRF